MFEIFFLPSTLLLTKISKVKRVLTWINEVLISCYRALTTYYSFTSSKLKIFFHCFQHIILKMLLMRLKIPLSNLYIQLSEQRKNTFMLLIQIHSFYYDSKV